MCVEGLTILFYLLENNREWMVYYIKLNDKGEFMSRKKISQYLILGLVLGVKRENGSGWLRMEGTS